jgi:hypothetical protein
MPSATRNGLLCGLLLAATYWLAGPPATGVIVALVAGLYLALGDSLGGWWARLVAGLTASCFLSAAVGLHAVITSTFFPLLSP